MRLLRAIHALAVPLCLTAAVIGIVKISRSTHPSEIIFSAFLVLVNCLFIAVWEPG